MDYSRAYFALVEKRRISPPPHPYDRHHILPRSMGGSNGKNNIVALTRREHYIAHLLLAHIHGGRQWLAVRFMAGIAISGQRFHVPSRIYARAIAESRQAQIGRKVGEDVKEKIRAKLKGKTLSVETKEKMSSSRIGKSHSAETKAKIGDAHRHRFLSDERRAQISASQAGVKRKPMSDEQKAKISDAHRGKKLSSEHREKLSVAKMGKPSPRCGVVLSDETKAKISATKAAKRKSKEQNATKAD